MIVQIHNMHMDFYCPICFARWCEDWSDVQLSHLIQLANQHICGV